MSAGDLWRERVSAEPIASTSRIFDLPLDALGIGHDFRLDDDPAALAELTESIRQIGIIQPLLVRRRDDPGRADHPSSGGWEILAGRRRLAAARHAGLATVPCIERTYDDELALHVTLAENLHRRHLSPIEEALGYAHLRAQGLSQAAIGTRVGRSQAHVGRLLLLLGLPGELRDRVHRGLIGVATALRARETTGRRQGSDKDRPGREDESVASTHWRRRHDRIIAGIQRIMDIPPPVEYRVLLTRLLRSDFEPLPEERR